MRINMKRNDSRIDRFSSKEGSEFPSPAVTWWKHLSINCSGSILGKCAQKSYPSEQVHLIRVSLENLFTETRNSKFGAVEHLNWLEV